MISQDIDALFLQTLQADLEEDDDPAWEAIYALRRIGSREVFEQATDWCHADDLRKKVRGVYVIAQLGTSINHGANSFPEESYSLIESLLPDANDLDLLEAVLNALGFIGNPLAIPSLVRFARHPNESIRFQVACALGNFPNDPRSVEILARLTEDVDDDVRDWATFGLGSQSDADSTFIRETLFNRLQDNNDVVRDEAIAGLAKRKDTRAIAPVLEGLEQTAVSPLIIEAATWVLDIDQQNDDWTPSDYADAISKKYNLQT
jgi:HEAT repeat protein